MSKIKNIVLLVLVALLSSCGAENEYTDNQCYFIFNTTYHPSTLMMESLTGYTGCCLVYKGTQGGINKVYVEKYGATDPTSPYMYTAADEPKVSELMIGTDNGLLIGHAAFDEMILAFDRHCPKCPNNSKAKLEWNGSAFSVKCPVCSTIYDLSHSGNGLERYPATYDGTYLRVVHM